MTAFGRSSLCPVITPRNHRHRRIARREHARHVHTRDRQWLVSVPSPTYRTICLPAQIELQCRHAHPHPEARQRSAGDLHVQCSSARRKAAQHNYYFGVLAIDLASSVLSLSGLIGFLEWPALILMQVKAGTSNKGYSIISASTTTERRLRDFALPHQHEGPVMRKVAASKLTDRAQSVWLQYCPTAIRPGS